MLECLTTVNVLALPTRSPDKPNQTHGCSPTVIQPDAGSAEEYVRICQIQECKARSIIPMEMGTVTAAKDASTD